MRQGGDAAGRGANDAPSGGSGVFLNRHSGIWTSLIVQLVKNPPAMQETPV